MNKQFPCRKTNSSSLCKCILACAMLLLLQKIKKNGWRSKFSNFSSFLDIPHLYFVHDYWFNRRTVKKYSVSSVCYSDSHFSYIPSNVCIISFPERKIFCLHFQRLLRLMCYTEISMNFSTTWAPGNSYYRFGSVWCVFIEKSWLRVLVGTYNVRLFHREGKIHSMILGSDVGPSKQKIFTENVTIVFHTLEEKVNEIRSLLIYIWLFFYLKNHHNWGASVVLGKVQEIKARLCILAVE